MAVIFGFTAPLLVGVAGLAMDTAGFHHQRNHMQSAADATALAIAKETHLHADDPATLIEAGKSRAEALLIETGLAERPYEVDVSLNMTESRAIVTLTMATEGFLPPAFWGDKPITVEAHAKRFGEARLCVLGLHETSSDTLKADNGAAVTAPECAVQSNSIDPLGMIAKNGSIVTARLSCTSGGYSGSGFVPMPDVDCPVLDDPLENRAPPAVGGCDFLDYVADKGTQSISPGHYCGGLTIKNDAAITAAPGIYIISDGKLEVGNEAVFRGENVGFYFADDAATMVLKDQAQVELSAPKTGAMAGLLFFESRNASEGRSFEISSQSARKLLGTIYLPRGVFKSGGTGNIADASAYTIIVARRLDLDGANLVLNAAYEATDVPVPEGLGPKSGNVVLEK